MLGGFYEQLFYLTSVNLSPLPKFRTDTPHGNTFFRNFLESHDFDVSTLKSICRELSLSVSGAKKDLIDRILRDYNESSNTHTHRIVVKHLITRTKSAIAFKHIRNVKQLPQRDPEQLLLSPGELEFYGPIDRPDDPGAKWYLFPDFIVFKENLDKDNPRELTEVAVRWLCFLRLKEDIISVHWHGFTIPDSLDSNAKSTFPYWNKVPRIFEKFAKESGGTLEEIRLDNIILEAVLETYRKNPEFRWNDKRVRALAGGVSLNARAGGYQRSNKPDWHENSDSDDNEVEGNIIGIDYLAETITRAIEKKLWREHEIKLPNPDSFVDEILITFIKKYYSLSYELRVANQDSIVLLHAHCYFGNKENSKSPDAFPHLQLRNGRTLDDLKQLNFLIAHM